MPNRAASTVPICPDPKRCTPHHFYFTSLIFILIEIFVVITMWFQTNVVESSSALFFENKFKISQLVNRRPQVAYKQKQQKQAFKNTYRFLSTIFFSVLFLRLVQYIIVKAPKVSARSGPRFVVMTTCFILTMCGVSRYRYVIFQL